MRKSTKIMLVATIIVNNCAVPNGLQQDGVRHEI